MYPFVCWLGGAKIHRLAVGIVCMHCQKAFRRCIAHMPPGGQAERVLSPLLRRILPKGRTCPHVLRQKLVLTMETTIGGLQYWEDEADALRPNEGTMLPLWRFTHRKSKRKNVTALKWHPVSCASQHLPRMMIELHASRHRGRGTHNEDTVGSGA